MKSECIAIGATLLFLCGCTSSRLRNSQYTEAYASIVIDLAARTGTKSLPILFAEYERASEPGPASESLRFTTEEADRAFAKLQMSFGDQNVSWVRGYQLDTVPAFIDVVITQVLLTHDESLVNSIPDLTHHHERREWLCAHLDQLGICD